MSRSQRSKRLEYTSAREMVEKRGAGFSAPYLKMPDGATMFKAKAGVMLLDILPYKAGEGNPWAEEGNIHWERTFWVHRGVGANTESFLCPRKNSKNPCPICEFRARLVKEADEEKEDLIQSLAPKERQLFNVRNLKDSDKGTQLWDFSYHMFGKLLQARIRDSDEDDGWDMFFTLDEGFTLKVGFTEKSYGGRAYFEAETIDFKPRQKSYDEDVLDDVFSLDEILVEEEYDKLKKTFLETADEEGGRRKRKDKEEDLDEDEEEKPRRKRRDADEDEEEEKPRKRRHAGDADEEEEDVPKKKKKKDLDEDDWDDFDKPKKKRAADADEDEEEEKPRKRRDADEEEEEEKPRRRRRDKDEDEEDPAPGKKKPVVEDEDWDETPKKKKKDRFRDEDEDEKPRVRAGIPKDEEEEEEEKPRRRRRE